MYIYKIVDSKVNFLLMPLEKTEKWRAEDAQVFWGEIAPSDHVVHIYEDDNEFIDLLEDYVVGGIRSGASVIIIATAIHIEALNGRLRSNGFDPFYLQVKEWYVPLDAEQTLLKFMINGWPDETLFMHLVAELLVKAKRSGRQVRAFGEMVAILWNKGMVDATLRLEHLWNKFLSSDGFCLFCAYPRSGFAEPPHDSLKQICATHSRIVKGAISDSNMILYTDAQRTTG